MDPFCNGTDQWMMSRGCTRASALRVPWFPAVLTPLLTEIDRRRLRFRSCAGVCRGHEKES